MTATSPPAPRRHPGPRIYRQGDVLLISVRTQVAGKPERAAKAGLVLALGEATGHAHVIRDHVGRAQLVREGDARFLKVDRPVELTHEEHGPLVIERGTYHVRIQREYVPPEEGVRSSVSPSRRVRD